MTRSVWVVECSEPGKPWRPDTAFVEKSDAEADWREAGYFYCYGAKPKFRVTEYVPKSKGYKEEE